MTIEERKEAEERINYLQEQIHKTLDFQEKFNLAGIVFGVTLLLVAAVFIIAYVCGATPSVDEAPAPAPKIVYETVVETVVEYKAPEPVIKVSSAERELLARLVYREARGESAECQRAVVSVVINRMAKNGESVKETIYAKGQFSTAGSLERTTPLEANYEAVDYVLANGSTLPEYVLYFSGGTPARVGGVSSLRADR